MPTPTAELTGSEPPALRPLDAATVRGGGAAELLRRRRTLERIRAAIDRIRARTTVEEVLACVPEELRTACRLRRVAVYARQGSELVPWAGDLPAPRTASGRWAPLVVLPGSAESEILRRGTPILAVTRTGDPGGRLLAHPCGYAAVAVRVDGRTLAVIAAAGGPHHEPDLADADALLEFAERLGWTLERLRLAERTARQQEQLRVALDAAQLALAGPGPIGGDVRLIAGPSPGAAVPAAAAAAWELTPREREVLQQLSDGKTNRRIGEELFLSEGTVKCHVKRILRKLNAANRAEAVARYLGAPEQHALALPLPAAGAPLTSIAPLRLLAHGQPVGGGR